MRFYLCPISLELTVVLTPLVITFTVLEGFTSKLYIEYKKTKRKINKRKNKKIFLKTFPKNLYKPNIM